MFMRSALHWPENLWECSEDGLCMRAEELFTTFYDELDVFWFNEQYLFEKGLAGFKKINHTALAPEIPEDILSADEIRATNLIRAGAVIAMRKLYSSSWSTGKNAVREMGYTRCWNFKEL